MKTPIYLIKQKYHEYNPNEYLPIYQNGQLANKWEFRFYKLRCLIRFLAPRPRPGFAR